MEKAYRYRIYPNKKQQILIHKTFGCVRFVYNYFLDFCMQSHKNTGKIPKFAELGRELTKLKQEYEWLQEPDKCALQNAQKNLNMAYANFFKHEFNLPKFKSKKSHRQSYRTNCSYKDRGVPSVEVANCHIKLPKLGWVKTKDRTIPEGRIINTTIKQEPTGKYYAIVCCTDIATKMLPKTNHRVGIDFGIKKLCVTSDGVMYDNPRFLESSLKKLTKLQQSLDRKTRGSKNWNKARIKVARFYEKVFNRKMDYLHKLSLRFIKDNDEIFIEDLDIEDMIANPLGDCNDAKRDFVRRVFDAGWFPLKTQLQYKGLWYGRTIHLVDRYYSSSQVCHVCGYKNPETKNTKVREWICPQCHTVLDRDVNAAVNLLHSA